MTDPAGRDRQRRPAFDLTALIRRLLRVNAGVRWDQAVLFVLALAIGVSVAYLALGFRAWIDALQWIGFEAEHERLVEAAAQQPAWRLVAWPVAGSVAIALILRFVVPAGRPHGVAEVMEAVSLREGRIDLRTGAGSVLAAATALGTGASTGREGPMVHAGATLASWIARRLHLSAGLTRTLLGCGAASAVAASFNAPIAGVLFALEVVVGHYTLHVWAPVVVAGVAGTVVTRAHLGDNPAFTVPPLEILSFWEFPAFLLLGLVSAAVGIAFMAAVIGAERVRQRLVPLPDWALPPVAGLFMGGVALYAPELLGVSYETTTRTLDGELALSLLLVLIPLKVLATSLCLACRFGGGVFSPSLFLGAITGGAFGLGLAALVTQIGPGAAVSSSGVYAIVGMAAVASAVLGAPISTMLIVFELTGNYEVTIAVMIASAIASLITQLFYRPSLFILQLEQRDIQLEGGKATHLLRATPVRAAMRADFAVVHEDDGYDHVRAMIMAHEGTKLPVVDSAGRLLGVVSLGRMIDAERWARDGAPVTARDLCRPDPGFLAADEPLGTGLLRMENSGDDSLPVVQSVDEPALVGMLHHTDVLEAYNRALLEAQGGLATPAPGGR
ncbi:hypothetical protein CCR85_00015 [Rhodothalassium salexigens]|uniref:chloride channel protein n=1 Tax=Rhodothalassium salexigens TaxID=1086 RepID=UPI001913FDF0|nr:chloride channel protein [Rhodothalassium salexigens]MBK5909878.1 hypothetical protein [Rhodothalassium salexigens]MBK5921295.1 hypothetical protein [Rhodothalassium salexigens]